MKINLLTIILVLFTSISFGQSASMIQASNVLQALKTQNYEELANLTDPNAQNILTPGVFKQIREVFVHRNDNPNTYIFHSKKDSISELAMKLINEMSKTQIKEDEISTEKFENEEKGELRIVRGKVTKTNLNLVMTFNEMNKLTQFYLEPIKEISNYENPIYAL